MEYEQILRYAAMIGCAALGLAISYLVYRYRQKYNLNTWIKQLQDDITKASGDESYRQAQLRETEAKLAEFHLPDPVQPITRNQEYYLQAVPKMLFWLGCGGAILTFLGLFQPRVEGARNWMIVAGPVFLATCGIVYLMMRSMRYHYSYLQLLNKKFLLLKAGNELEKSIPALKTLLEHYPSVPELWMEMSDQLAKAGRLDDALKAVNEAAKLAPNHVDVVMIELSLQIRRGALREAKDILDTLPNYKTLPTDPRQSLYTAALYLKKNEPAKALEAAKKALELDKKFSEKFVTLDPTLQDVDALLREKKLVER